MAEQGRLTRDFTKGSIPRELTQFMLPFMATNALQVLYSVVDMIIVGRFVGSAGLTAVSQGSLFVNFVAMLALGFFSAGQIIASQLLGAERKEELSVFEGSFFAAGIVVSAAFTLATFLLKGPAMKLLNLPGDSMQMGQEYVFICAWGVLFVSGYNVVTAIMKGLGDSRRPLIFIIAAAVANLGLDVLFVGKLGWGVAGAAWATVIGQAASFIAAILFFYKNREGYHCNIDRSMFRIRKDILQRVVSLGVPMSVMAAGINITMLFVNRFVNSLGIVAASATFGAGIKLDDIFNKISLGVQMAAAPMIGQNLGAGRHDRIKKTVYWTWVFSAVMVGIFMFAFLNFGREMFSLFVDDPAVLDLSRTFILAAIWTFPGMALMRGGNSLLNGIGNTRLLMILSFLDSFLRAATSYLFGVVLNMGFYGFVLGFAIAPYGVAVPGTIYFLSGKWEKRGRVID